MNSESSHEDDHEDCACLSHGPGAMKELEAAEAAQSLDGWALLEKDGILRLEKIYQINLKISGLLLFHLAEAVKSINHHPAISSNGFKLQVSWWTHDAKGLTDKDFIMAQNTDIAYEQSINDLSDTA